MPLAWCKNLETGVRARQNVGEKGRDFLSMQQKPHIGKNGKYYPDGVWVLDAKPLSDEAEKIVSRASEPAPMTRAKAPTAATNPVQ